MVVRLVFRIELRRDFRGGGVMIEFAMYQKAKADTRAARASLNYASVALELAEIKERLAEMASQHEPLAALRESAMMERDRLYAAAYYAVVGRLPERTGIRRSNRMTLGGDLHE